MSVNPIQEKTPIGQLVDWSVYFAQICFCKEISIIIYIPVGGIENLVF